MARTALTAIAFTATLAACTPAEQAAIMTLGPNPTTDGGSFSTGGGLTVAAEILPIAGRTGLCGVWSESKRQSVLSRGTAPRVISSGSAYIDGQILHRDLGFMRKTAPQTSYAGQQATCVQTSRPWSPSDVGKRVELRLPRQIVNRENEDDGSASIQVVFTQDGPGAFNPALKSLFLDN